ncbi:MAG TPA: hypothetical protein DHV74_13340, partial [Sulfitobacter sp.]|nr:hypothetical protein [Sulfitobacter sp.]
MSRGFIGGILIGAVFSVGVAGVASFMVPMGPAPLQDTPVPSDAPDAERATNAPEMAEPPVVAADETPLTAAEDTNEDVITPEPVVEEPVVEEPTVEPEPETVPRAEVAPEVEAPVAQEAVQDIPSEDAPDVAAAPETVEPEPQPEPEVAPTPQPAPQIAQDIDATAPVTVPDAAAPKITLDDPVLPNPMALAPMEPTEPDALGIETRTAPPVTADESVDTPVSPTPDTDVATAPSAPDAQPEEAPADVVFGAPEQRTDGRPTIGTPAAITSER